MTKVPDYHIEFQDCPGYLKATVTGQNSRETVAAYLKDLLSECRRRDCFRVLIDERLAGPRLDAMEVFAVASKGSLDALGVFDAIAYVDRDMGPMGEFAETVAINRGMPVAFFDNEDDAKRWLTRPRSGQSIFLPSGDEE